jgi:murein L,D-transpeptidase YcbB/YkuD
MNHQKQRLSTSTILIIALMPLLASADTSANSCPILMTEQECNEYEVSKKQIKTQAERLLFNEKYASLMKERAQLCQCNFQFKEAAEEGLNQQHVHQSRKMRREKNLM